jgi:hypothetical protein
VERQDLKVLRPQVVHADCNDFIINSASLSNVDLHHQIASLPIAPISPADWLQCARDGYAAWSKTPNNNADDLLEEGDQSGDDAAEEDAEEADTQEANAEEDLAEEEDV